MAIEVRIHAHGKGVHRKSESQQARWHDPPTSALATHVDPALSTVANRLPKTKEHTMVKEIRRFMKEEEGASAAEYAVLITLITLFLVASVGGLGGAIQTAINGAAAVIAPS